MMKINKHALKCDFFDIITSEYNPVKTFNGDKHSISLRMDDKTTKFWNYDSLEERDQDYQIIIIFKTMIK